MNYDLNDIVVLKKPHPCLKRSKEFLVVRMGADIRIKCLGCEKTFLLSRADLEEKIEKVVKK
ncbi:MAG: DUF951 domain-containing protein [Bacilli bacterium]|nr:DUF951 domain-containing protein [Bacilli bacterium]